MEEEVSGGDETEDMQIDLDEEVFRVKKNLNDNKMPPPPEIQIWAMNSK